MNKALPRLLLTCLLAIALPLKGLAASSMLACGPNHHSGVAAGAHGHGVALPHAHEHGAHATSAHAHEHASAATPAAHGHEHGNGAAHEHAVGDAVGAGAGSSGSEAGGAATAAKAPDLKSMSKCGTCAPCCVSAVLTSNPTLRIAAAANSADFPAFAAGHASPPAGRLDRPPRSFLA